MTPRARMNRIRLIEKMESKPEYAKKLKVENSSKYKRSNKHE